MSVDLLAPPAAYAVPLAWAVLVTISGFARRRIPLAAVPFPVVAAITVNTATSGPVAAAASTLLAVVIVTGMLALGTLSRTGLLLWPVLLPAIPAAGWLLAFAPAFAAAGAVAAVRLRRAAGPGYLPMLAGETFAAVGADQANLTMLGVSRPDVSRLPVQPAGHAADVKVRLSLFIAAGLACTAALALAR